MTTAAHRPQLRPPVALPVTLPGVYAPQSDTLLLADALRREHPAPGTQVLDLCTGSGYLGLYAARLGARVTAVDISRRAVATARLNALLAGRRLAVHRGDLLAALPHRRTFDLLVSNPPYVPAPPAHTPGRAARAWDAGADGRALLDRICRAAPAALRPHGVLLLVHSVLSDPDTTVRRLTRAGLDATVSRRARVPWGPVLRRRLGWLRERHFPGAFDDSEELVVIRAGKP